VIALFVVFACLFLISIFTLSYVQIRLWRKSGWRIFSTKSPIELYWNNRTVPERWLIWPGIVCFMGLVLVALVSLIWQHVRQ
jgi:hypothetical protein